MGIISEKAERQTAIRDLIETRRVNSQEELKLLLLKAGYPVAQATLSRDIKEMGIAKTAAGYRLPPAPPPAGPAHAPSRSLHAESVVSLEFVRGMAVMKTVPSHASMVAALIDAADPAPVAGTIAGDDTIFLMLRAEHAETDIVQSLDALLPGIGQKLRHAQRGH